MVCSWMRIYQSNRAVFKSKLILLGRPCCMTGAIAVVPLSARKVGVRSAVHCAPQLH